MIFLFIRAAAGIFQIIWNFFLLCLKRYADLFACSNRELGMVALGISNEQCVFLYVIGFLNVMKSCLVCVSLLF